MISGPVLPRTREGLRAVVESHLDRIEGGLRQLEREPWLDNVLVDALCRDAAGAPVLLFLAEPGAEMESLERVFRARLWLLENGGLLRDLVPLRGLDPDRAARSMLVGFDFPWSFVRLLPGTGLPDLEVYAVRSLSYGGQMRVQVVPVHGRACEPVLRGERVPEGITRSEQRVLFARLQTWLRRLDTDLSVRGDRYGRIWFYDGAPLAEVALRDRRLSVRIPCADAGLEGAATVFVIEREEDCRRAADRVARRYLELLARRSAQDPASDEFEEEPSRECRDGVEAGGAGPTPAPERGLDRLRSTIREAQLTEEEFLALGGALHAETEDLDDDGN